MKILITGSNGFIGRHLVTKLKSTNYQVLDYPNCIKGERHNKFNKDTDWSLILKDVTHVIHLAAIAHKKASFEEYIETNDLSTYNLVNQSFKNNVKKVIFLSTIKVLGENNLRGPFNENDIPNPIDNYSLSKLHAEQKVSQLSKKYNKLYTIIRPTLIYGKGVKANMATLIKFISFSPLLPFKGLNKSKRNLLYIDNLIDFLIVALEDNKTDNEIFHICDDKSVSVYELVREISSKFNKSYLFFGFPTFIYKFFLKLFGLTNILNILFNSLEVDNTKAKTLTNWKPTYSFSDGIRKTIIFDD